METQELKWLLALCVMGVPLTVDAAPPDQIGHYYLQGVREVGSELRLKPGGRYDWYMSYGAMDSFSKGTWRRAGNDITLTVDAQDPKAAIFKLDMPEVWNERAEAKVREPLFQGRLAEINERCPFLADDVDYVSPPPYAGDRLVDSGAALKAGRAGADAIVARTLVERATTIAVDAKADRDGKMKAAADAMKAWKLAKLRARDAYDDAKIRVPDLAEPKLPDACDIPTTVDAADIPTNKWIRGVAVVVGDPATEMRFSGITVVFGYGDGSLSKGVVTDNEGWAIAPDRKIVTRISLSLRGPNPRNAWFDVGPMAEGIQPITLDSKMVIDPPFKTMTLHIDGQDLVPENGRGRYARH